MRALTTLVQIYLLSTLLFALFWVGMNEITRWRERRHRERNKEE